jgi:tRNA 2-selenouridine synthase SelU
LQAQDKHHCSRIVSYQNRAINLLTVKTVVLCSMVSCEIEMVLQSMISAIDEDRTIEILSYRFVETMIKQSGLGDKTEDSYL